MEGEVAGVGLEDHLVRIVAVIEEVQLAEEHAPQALLVAAGQDAQRALVAVRVVEVEADVEHRLRQAAVEEVAQGVDVPAEARVARAGLVDELVDHDAVLLVLAEAELGAAGGAHRLPALVGEEVAQPAREERGEGEAVDEGLPSGRVP